MWNCAPSSSMRKRLLIMNTQTWKANSLNYCIMIINVVKRTQGNHCRTLSSGSSVVLQMRRGHRGKWRQRLRSLRKPNISILHESSMNTKGLWFSTTMSRWGHHNKRGHVTQTKFLFGQDTVITVLLLLLCLMFFFWGGVVILKKSRTFEEWDSHYNGLQHMFT